MTEKKDPQQTLTNLRQQHDELHKAVYELQRDPRGDSVVLSEMKKRKLKLKDRIARFEAALAAGDTTAVLTLIEGNLDDDVGRDIEAQAA